MSNILFLNVEALIGALFWCSLSAFCFLYVYQRNCSNPEEKRIVSYLIFSKLLHSFSYFCFYGREYLPDWISVNLGNSAFFIGFFLEAQVILLIIRERTQRSVRALLFMTLGTLFAFNAMELTAPEPSSGLRVALASLCVIGIMMLPNIKMLKSRDSSSFARSIATMYILFLLLLLPRAWYNLADQNAGILTNSVVQSLTFESLLLILLFSIPAYILIMKEYRENALVLMATTDKVTGATNRHAFVEATNAVYDEHVRLGLPLSVLFLDIDYFKDVNDRYGHAFGDAVLQRLSEAIDRCLRSSDFSCRYGGEEFVILLPQARRVTADLVGRRIMKEIESIHFEGKADFTFTVSIGVCSRMATPDETLENFIDRADKAMYEAKRTGRNRMVIYD